MSFIAVVLLTFAAFFHAAWNLVSKQHSPCSAFFLAANLWGALIFLPVVIFCAECAQQNKKPELKWS